MSPTTCALLTLLLLPALAAFSADDAGNRVKTGSGTLEGTTLPSGVRAFKGVPYAAPPVGDLRWKPPQPAKAWEGVRTA